MKKILFLMTLLSNGRKLCNLRKQNADIKFEQTTHRFG